MARSGKLRCFFTSLPVKIWCSRALVACRILVTSTGLSAGLADRRPGRWKTARPAGRPARWLSRQIIAPSEKRIRTLLQALDAAALDMLIGGWLAALAALRP